MKTNVEKVLERDQKLSELDDRAGKLSVFRLFLICRPFFLNQIKYVPGNSD